MIREILIPMRGGCLLVFAVPFLLLFLIWLFCSVVEF